MPVATAVAGNSWTLSTGIQASQGTAFTTGHMKQRYTGGFGPVADRQTITLAETDAQRMSGDPVVVGIRIQGDSEHYIRPDEFHRDAYLLMGSNADSGTTNYTHTATATTSGSAPYATLIRALNATTLVDQYVDCQISQMVVRGGAEQACTYTKTWLGLTPTFGATDTALTASASSPYVYPEVTVTKNSVTTDVVTSFELTINQNRTLIMGDQGISAAAVATGLFAVTGSLTILFQNDQDWRAFQTGATAGTVAGTTIYTQPLTLTLTRDANTSIAFTMQNIIATAYNPPGDTGGAPIQVPLTFQAKRSTTLGNVLTIVTKNQVATPTS